jgi:hypothetical protein
MALQKLNQRKRFRRSPCLVGQTQRAEQNEDEDGYVRENSYLHAEPCRDCRLGEDAGFAIPYVTLAQMDNATVLVAFWFFGLFLLWRAAK